jgi:hypothetical protein
VIKKWLAAGGLQKPASPLLPVCAHCRTKLLIQGHMVPAPPPPAASATQQQATPPRRLDWGETAWFVLSPLTAHQRDPTQVR